MDLKAIGAEIAALEKEIPELEAKNEQLTTIEHAPYTQGGVRVQNCGFDPSQQARLQNIHKKKHLLQNLRDQIEHHERETRNAAALNK